MPISVQDSEFVELLLEFEHSQDREELKQHFCLFLNKLGFDVEIFLTDTGVYLTLTSHQAKLSLLWFPKESHYCPKLAGCSDIDLPGLSMEEYRCIWQAFNACSHAIWQLPLRYKQILEALSKGKNLQEISTEVNLSLPSVKRYMFLIRELLGARTNPHAIAIATRQGWI